ncbi:MAG: serine/threonine protein kinase [Myxococcales bacterium]|nr:serine/threonine protein kinase [Myxococcales bacterium]
MSSFVDRPRELGPGARIGDVWAIDHALGRGGMGTVFACHNKDAPAIRAAIKVLDGFAEFHPIARKRFLREAEILYGLDHPNLVRVANIVLDQRPPYIEMELVEGVPLTRLLASGPLALDTALGHARQIADALAYLHRRKVFHRDVKPENLIVQPDGTVKLVDFGLAKKAGLDITVQGTSAFGTVEYCPPEWMDAEALEPAAWDCYALGVVLHEMLTGQMAFRTPEGLSQADEVLWILARKHDLEDGLDPGPAFPDAVRALVGDLTALDRERRPCPGQEVVRRLRSLP